MTLTLRRSRMYCVAYLSIQIASRAAFLIYPLSKVFIYLGPWTMGLFAYTQR